VSVTSQCLAGKGVTEKVGREACPLPLLLTCTHCLSAVQEKKRAGRPKAKESDK